MVTNNKNIFSLENKHFLWVFC